MKNYPTSSSMFSLSSSPLFHTSGTITATTATPATAAVATFDSSPSTLNNASSLSMMSKKNYAIPSSSSMILPLSLSSPVFPTSKNTIAFSNCTAIATAIAIATETTATDDSDSDTATDDKWGIESESIRKKTYRLGALEEVFIEQEEQYLGDYYNDEAIAHAYYSVSNECQLHAERIAIQDRKDIEEYIYEGLYETI
ncbi:hypothetical protein FRACYDRAFT_243819 [Fragilariopsis cylindrus CCMP1102]|uniref:Uncharacterized protein n=1 Tax=Fragilariopsis cylindrus CCMP1102 TaxID=635003 RepID=A0A1E7F2Z7_9STRA|nr:hypothetical protein FRACYDRAFT_243819 [Fragilariopsis cylindrus CCMP1102]|eukprot:OEU12568.1 hypothetical protein FRACYDRAFT_243819 [Fragilariopsis cylindrus CCMP1102]